MTQQQVADRLGLSASSLAKWERAERRIDVIDLRDYVVACGIDFVEFIARWSKLADEMEMVDNVEVLLKTRPRRQASPDERLKS